MIRQIITIDEDKCDGCGLCIPGCKEGALQIIDGKARLISDLFCDGLGACLGTCPQNAILIEEREAEPYNERKVIEYLVNQPVSVLKAHLLHLLEHNEIQFFEEAVNYLNEKNIPLPLTIKKKNANSNTGCPGSQIKVIDRKLENNNQRENQNLNNLISELKQWPIQLHLVRHDAPYFNDKELVVMATCAPVAFANIQKVYLKDKSIVIACPKLDYTEPYIDKLTAIFNNSNINKVTIVIMEVPCCNGLSNFVKIAHERCSNSNIEIIEDVITLDGRIKSSKQIK